MSKDRYEPKVRGTLTKDWAEKTGLSMSSTLAAMSNPDILSEDSVLFPVHDLETREQRIELINEAYKAFTDRQRMILKLLMMGLTHRQVGEALRISKFAVSRAIERMQNKVKKLAGRMREWE